MQRSIQVPNIQLYKVHMPLEVDAPLLSVLHSGQLAGGPNVAQFEQALQAYLGNPYLTATGDVSSSIVLCLYLAGVRPGDEVVVSPMACLATNEPVLNLFARVVWCDIDPLTGNIDPTSLERHISPRTKAILVYHWAGNPADLDAISQVARQHNLRVVEDAGEALGAEYHGRKIGNNSSDFTVFSFYPNRHITTGEGAAVAFGQAQDYERGLWLKRYGIHQPTFRDDLGEINPNSDILEAGYNTSMNHLAATLGLVQMAHLNEIVRRHVANGEYYDRALQDVSGITILKRLSHTRSAYWVYTLLADRRNDLLQRLRERGVSASKVHLRNDLYTCFGSGRVNYPGLNEFSDRCLSIPCGWWVTSEDREYIVDCIRTGW